MAWTTPATAVPDVPTWPTHDRRVHDKDSNGHRTSFSTAIAERRTWTPGSGYSIIACVDVQPAAHTGVQPERNDLLWRLALRRMERCVRSGDQVCMLGGPRVAVVLGNGSNRVAPSALGKRLARAMGDHLAVGATGLDLRVAIGVGAGTSDVEPAALTAAALSSLRLTRNRASTNGHVEPSPFVAVTHVPGHQALAPPAWRPTSDLEGGRACQRNVARQPRRLDCRVLVPLSEDLDLAVPTSRAAPGMEYLRRRRRDRCIGDGIGTASTTRRPRSQSRPQSPTDGGRRGGHSPAVRGPCRSSPRPSTSTRSCSTCISPSPMSWLSCCRPSCPDTGPAQTSHCGWDGPARITRALRAVGTPVIALSVGASVAALAVCVEQGAVGLFHTDLLSQELARQATRRLNANGGPSAGGYDEPRGPGQLPAPYDSLVHLTPSERRVLFHMMEGRSAAEIATTLVVSLTTVRSHIRSILRKLNVNSQLAAVALAFGMLPDQAVAE